MKKELKVKESNEVAVNNTWGCENIDSKDTFVSRINLAQSLSDVVSDGSLVAGDFYDSVNKTKIEDLEIIVFNMFKSWQILRKVPGKNRPEYVETVPFSSENANWSWNDGDLIRNITMNYYVLLVTADGVSPSPSMISFSRTSLAAGKTIATKLQALKIQNKPAAAITFKLESELRKNDNGKYHVIIAKPGRATTEDEISIAKHWFDGSENIKIKEPVETKTTDNEVEEASDVPF